MRSRFPSFRTRSISGPSVSRVLRGNARELLVEFACSDLNAFESEGCDSSSVVLVRNDDGQNLAPLFTASAQYCASPFRLHPRTESMLAHSARIAGTVCRLAHDRSRAVLRIENETTPVLAKPEIQGTGDIGKDIGLSHAT